MKQLHLITLSLFSTLCFSSCLMAEALGKPQFFSYNPDKQCGIYKIGDAECLADSASTILYNNCAPEEFIDSDLTTSLHEDELNFYEDFINPTIIAFIPHATIALMTSLKKNDPELGMSIYRGLRCLELGSRGLERLYSRKMSAPITSPADLAEAQSKDRNLNRSMFAYLLIDSMIPLLTTGIRPDLAIHHGMGLIFWGAALNYNVFQDVISLNSAVEILSTFKGLEYAVKKEYLGDRKSLSNQRILKSCNAFRLLVIGAVRFPMWIIVDWSVPDTRYEEAGPIGWAVFKGLNLGIIGLEILWLKQTWTAYQRARFF